MDKRQNAIGKRGRTMDDTGMKNKLEKKDVKE